MKTSLFVSIFIFLACFDLVGQESKILLSPQFNYGLSKGHFINQLSGETFKNKGLANGFVFLLGMERNQRFRMGMDLSYNKTVYNPDNDVLNMFGVWGTEGTYNIQLQDVKLLSLGLITINLGINIQNKIGEKGGLKFWLNNTIGTETIISKQFEVIGTGFVQLGEDDISPNVINRLIEFDYEKSNVASFYLETGLQVEYQILSNFDIFFTPQIRIWEHREEEYFGLENSNDFTNLYPEDNLWLSRFSLKIGMNFRI